MVKEAYSCPNSLSSIKVSMPNRSICLFTLSGKFRHKGNVTITGDFRTPGQLIKDLLDARGWSQRVLAMVLGGDETGMAKSISRKTAASAELALPLSEVFDVPAERFLAL